ncbi:MAG: ATPase [Arcobacter sp.]|nr:MAG: ATPase [Arcobacter sp.]
MIKKQFRSFYFRHMIHDIEKLIEYFSVFGGLGWKVDIDASLEDLIQTEILDNFGSLYNQITELTTNEPQYLKLLTNLARGDRRIFSAFNKSGLTNLSGGLSLKHLQEMGVLEAEYSREEPPIKDNNKLKREVARHRISHKMRFTSPFLRFWFYFIAPMKKEIELGHYQKVMDNFRQHHQAFIGYTFEELSNVLLKHKLSSSQLVDSGSYWDRHVEIDLMATTLDNKLIIGECKWKNHKLNKKELNKIHEKCEKVGFEPDILMLFSKRGFSKELLSMQDKELRLYSCEDFEDLLSNISQADLIQGFERE